MRWRGPGWRALVFAGAACLAAIANAPSTAAEAAREYLREQRTVRVQGASETWRLVWQGKPKAVCGPEEVAIAITCPCSGWAYGEYGALSLVRSRNGRAIDRMDLRPLFGKFDYPAFGDVEGTAYLQRWPMQDGDFDRGEGGDPTLIAEIKRRAAPKVMQFADYDRDGQATEFLVQVGTLPCGKRQFAAIGVSAKNPRLHALASVGKPGEPLILPLHAWQALLDGPGARTVPTWACADHGSEVRTELTLAAYDGDIVVQHRIFSCPEDGSPEQLIEEADW